MMKGEKRRTLSKQPSRASHSRRSLLEAGLALSNCPRSQRERWCIKASPIPFAKKCLRFSRRTHPQDPSHSPLPPLSSYLPRRRTKTTYRQVNSSPTHAALARAPLAGAGRVPELAEADLPRTHPVQHQLLVESRCTSQVMGSHFIYCRYGTAMVHMMWDNGDFSSNLL